MNASIVFLSLIPLASTLCLGLGFALGWSCRGSVHIHRRADDVVLSDDQAAAKADIDKLIERLTSGFELPEAPENIRIGR